MNGFAISLWRGRRSATSQNPRPAGVTIRPRDERFGRESLTPQSRWWLGGDAVATAVFNALSITFPRGEASFIEAIKAHRHCAEGPLLSDIQAFVKQEVAHSREHLAFNRRVVDAGYDITALDRRIDSALALTATRSPIFRLATTVTLEHFTAVMAHLVLSQPAILRGADEASAALWRWHAVEEIEHKGVAFDTWLVATKEWSGWRRWKMRSLVMLFVSARFTRDRLAGTLELLRQDGFGALRAWAGLAWYMLGNPGFFRRILVPWCAYFRPGFHPWQHDDTHLITDQPAPAQNTMSGSSSA